MTTGSHHRDLIPYEDIAPGNEASVEAVASRILAEGWKLGSYPSISVGRDIPWALKTPSLRSWNFHIHCWDMLNPLLKAYSENGTLRFLVAAIQVAEDWVNHYPNPKAQESDGSFAWYDMAVGMRAYRLAYLLQSARHCNLLDAHLDDRLWKSLRDHQRYLADDANIKFHNNHGYYQVAGQLAMGRRFSDQSSEMAEAVHQGRERLARILEQQFTAEGVHREHSPDYHRMVYETLKALIDAGLVEDTDAIAFADKIERALAWFVLPNQRIANFGDSDYRLMRRNRSDATRKWRTHEMRYWVTSGKLGHAHDTHWAAFPESGYFVARHPDAKRPDRLEHSSYLAQTCAFHSRTHKHADDLSFIWSEHGSDILVDAGRYGYLGKTELGSPLWHDGHWYADPGRVYCESTRAHNTLEFDEANLARKGVRPYGSALTRWAETKDGLLAAESECRHFRRIRHARLLFFLPGDWLVVFDWFHDNLQGTHDVKQWFHLAPDLELKAEAGTYQVELSGTDSPLQVASLLPEPTASPPIIGQDMPTMQGWWSPTERELRPNFAFSYSLTNARTGVFATLFAFTEKLTIQDGRINTSGRKGQFSWRDDRGTHKLFFERPQRGNLRVGRQFRKHTPTAPS